eukprot:s2689_g16.t1
MRPRRRHSATYKVQSRSIIKNHCMLSRSEFFKGSSEKFLHELSTMLEVDLFLPGQDIIQQGEEGDKMYFLNWGSVQVMLGDQVVGDISPGSVFGEMALFSNGKRSCTVRATDTCDCRSVDQHRFQRLLNSYPEERARFEKLIEGRQQETTKLKQDLRRQREPQEERGGSRLRNLTLRSLSVIAKMGMNNLRRPMQRGSRNSEGSRNSLDVTPRRPGRPTTWPTMADVQEGNQEKASAGSVSLAKAVFAKMGKASLNSRSPDESQLSEGPTEEPGSSQGARESIVSNDSMEVPSWDSSDWSTVPVVPEAMETDEDPVAAVSVVSPSSASSEATLPAEVPSPRRSVAQRRSGLCGPRTSLGDLVRRWPSVPLEPRAPRPSVRRRQSAFPRLVEEPKELAQKAAAQRSSPWSNLPVMPVVDLEEIKSDPFVPRVSPFDAGLPPIHVLNMNCQDLENCHSQSFASTASEISGSSLESEVADPEPVDPAPVDPMDQVIAVPRNCFEMHMVKGKFQLGPSTLGPPAVRNRAKVGFWWLERCQ